MTVTCRDWRSVSAEIVRPLFETECDRWDRGLGWNYRPACALIEAARCHGRLPGVLAVNDRGDAVGWTYYMLHRGRLHIGALVARHRVTARALLDAVLLSPEARAADSVSCFLYPPVPLERVLARRRFTTTRHAYLASPIGHPSEHAASARRLIPPPDPLAPSSHPGGQVVPWSPLRVAGVAEMFAAAYEGMPESRCFTGANEVDEWLMYLAHITSGSVCGEFRPDLSAIVETARGEIAAAILATQLADDTIHVAQVAVAPSHRRQGLAARLVRLIRSRGAAAGCQRVTLLVADSNAGARRLYAGLGFSEVDAFVFGIRA